MVRAAEACSDRRRRTGFHLLGVSEMIFPWVGKLNVVFIAVEVSDPRYEPLPDDWRAVIKRRIFYDPEESTGTDRSLRAYVNATSSGNARFDATLVGRLASQGAARDLRSGQSPIRISMTWPALFFRPGYMRAPAWLFCAADPSRMTHEISQ